MSRANGLGRQGECIQIAVVNNMPDLVLEDTELQFKELIRSAAEDIPVQLTFFSLPGIPRRNQSLERVDALYCGFAGLFKRRFDAVIVTGTEPRESDLRREPYWPAFVDLLEWAREHTVSAVLSCLAAHAAVLYSDGIPRLPLKEKRFGVFEFRTARGHALTRTAPEVLSFPHSRWNELAPEALTSRGYAILTQSDEAGVDLFVKKHVNSLFVHFQGHPEYSTDTLLKEYRRDARRFLRGGTDHYPYIPKSYFNDAAVAMLSQFRERALADRSEVLMTAFPEKTLAANLRNRWHLGARSVYRSWLQYINVNRSDRDSTQQAVVTSTPASGERDV